MVLLLLIIVLTACTNTKEEEQDNHDNNNTGIQPMHFETDKKAENRNNGEDNQRQNKTRYSDVFTNEESIMLSEKLEKRKGINRAQVASTDERVIVAVMLSDHSDHNITKKIEADIKEIIPDKQIVIYTDDTHWERMKNLDARLESKNIGNDVEDNLKELFNIND